jgi:hypothetical protein
VALIAQTKATLTRKYGPLPGWAWVGILAGGTYLFLRYRQGQAGSDQADQGATDGTGAGDIPPGGTVTQSPVRNQWYGIRKCPPGYHKVGNRCRPKPCPRGTVRAGARCVHLRHPRHSPAYKHPHSVNVRHPAYVPRGVATRG